MHPESLEAPTNRPIYSPVIVNNKSAHHLFICEGHQSKEFQTLYSSIEDPKKNRLLASEDEFSSDHETIVVTHSALKEKLTRLLAELPLSTTIYLQGCEAFMWDLHSVAIQAGMVAEQVKMFAPVSRQRRLFCTHCHHITEDVTHSPAVCSYCQRNLLVRDHFSRLHSAYVGVQINAEDPADLPLPQELS
ncbi:dimethylamine monooxygenase subunit DmmA family protein [Neptunomonas sp.]|uniref:dimethylamine monooxygenase subunit DmmA family protein n=1 Tax=Neptunomonas sp. TaxID=1971898 RepID=UPI003569737A